MNRPFALLLVLLAMMLRIAVPGGWMVTAAPGGAALALCSGRMPPPDAPRIRLPHAPAQDDDGTTVDQPCAFAALGQAVRPEVASAASLVRPAPLALPMRVHHAVAIGRGLAAPPPPATGPPAFA